MRKLGDLLLLGRPAATCRHLLSWRRGGRAAYATGGPTTSTTRADDVNNSGRLRRLARAESGVDLEIFRSEIGGGENCPAHLGARRLPLAGLVMILVLALLLSRPSTAANNDSNSNNRHVPRGKSGPDRQVVANVIS